ncbi:MAG: hypothetical protein ACPG1C_12330 [Alphaproteobacteria bacterium]
MENLETTQFDPKEKAVFKSRIQLQRVVARKTAPWIEQLPESDLKILLEYIYQTEFLPRADEAMLDVISLELDLAPVSHGFSDKARTAAYDQRHKEIASTMAEVALTEIKLGVV